MRSELDSAARQVAPSHAADQRTGDAGYDRRIGMVAARLEHLERIESYGIRRVELVIMDPAEQEAVHRHLARTGVALSAHYPIFRDPDRQGYPLLDAVFDTDRERQELSLRRMERELLVAADLGATHMVAHLQRAVRVLGEAVPDGWTAERVLDAALRGAERLAAASQRAGLPVHLENMLGHPLFARPEQYLAVLEQLPPGQIALCLDVGHAALDGLKYGFLLSEFVEMIASRVGSLHLYTNRVDGEFDFETLREQGRLRKYPVHPTHSEEQGWIPVAQVVDQVLSRNPQALPTFEVYFALDTDQERTRAGLDWIAERCARWWTEKDRCERGEPTV